MIKNLWLLVILPGLHGCVADRAGPIRAAEFSDVFEPAGTIMLEELRSDPIVDIEQISVGSDGMIAIADRPAERVRIFGPDGHLVRTIGRKGGGPGEFDGLADAVFDSAGRLYTADAGNGRISRFGRALEFDTAFLSPGTYTYRLQAKEDELIAITHERGKGLVWRLDIDGRPLDQIRLPDSTAWNVPYWGSVLTRDFVEFGRDLFVSNSLLYPIWRVDTVGTVHEFGEAPQDFEEASRPALGQFVGARQTEVQEWLQSFTRLARLVSYRDSLLVVVHGAYRPTPGEPWRDVQVAMDLYDRKGKKLYAQVGVPGKVLSGGRYLYVLTAEPPNAWTITKFQRAD